MRQRSQEANRARSGRAERVIRHYSRTSGYSGEADYEADITDLLTDLQHFCAGTGLDFDELVERSRRHYRAEKKEKSGNQRVKELWQQVNAILDRTPTALEDKALKISPVQEE